MNRTRNVGLSNCTSFLAQQLNSVDYGSRNSHRGSCFVPLELARDGVVGSAANKAAAAKAPKTAMMPVIRNSHRGSWFVPLELARDGVVGSVPRRPAAAKAPKTVWCSRLPSRLQVRLALLLLRLPTPGRRRSRSSTQSILIVTYMWSDQPFLIYT